MDHWIIPVFTVIFAAYYFFRDSREMRHLAKHVIPDQLAQLVYQAHTGGNFKVQWKVRIDDKMRTALRIPLAPQQIDAMTCATEDISTFVQCKTVDFKTRAKEISGVVSVTLDITSPSGKYDFHCRDVRLHITLTTRTNLYDSPWIVRSVEQVES